jgi:hypothetical protein
MKQKNKGLLARCRITKAVSIQIQWKPEWQ